MELTNEFTVGVPVERAWEVLTDVELIAPCMPGAAAGDRGRGVSGRREGQGRPDHGPVQGGGPLRRRGRGRPPGRVAGRGPGTRGQGNANATITATMAPDGDGTTVVGRDRPHGHGPGRPVRPGRAGRRVVEAARPVRRLPGASWARSGRGRHRAGCGGRGTPRGGRRRGGWPHGHRRRRRRRHGCKLETAAAAAAASARPPTG